MIPLTDRILTVLTREDCPLTSGVIAEYLNESRRPVVAALNQLNTEGKVRVAGSTRTGAAEWARRPAVTTSTVFRITTTATAYDGETVAYRDTVDHVLTADEVAAGKYLLESEGGGAARIARDRHLDALDTDGRFDGLTIWVGSS